MPISATLVAPQRALPALAEVIAASKGHHTLAPITVAVPTNSCGVMTRRALGRAGGVAAVDMVTLNRLAELIAGPRLAAAGRSPISTPVIDLAIAAELAADPGPFGAVADHPSTVVALRNLHRELRAADADGIRRLADESVRGRQVLRVSNAVAESLAGAWYDDADLFASAREMVVQGRVPPALRCVVLYLPHELSGVASAFVRALGDRVDVRVVAQRTGNDAADGDTRTLLESLGPSEISFDHTDPPGIAGRPGASLVSTTDADEEVREATQLLVEAARSGVPFERMAVLWPTQRPYARLVEHHLTAAEIPWSGRPGTTLAEGVVSRLVLDLLDVDRRGLRRRSVFDLLADVPLIDTDGAHLPRMQWERVSRQAGVARDDDWDRRLGALAASERWEASATSLRSFVAELRNDLGHRHATRSWAEWASWCTSQVDRRLGATTIAHLPEHEYRSYEQLTAALDRLSHLDPVSEPVTRHRFRTTLEAELDSLPLRRGRVGHGVTVGPLAGAIGIDVDVTVMLGAAEGLLPPRPNNDPLLSDADRALAGLATADAHAVRLHRLLLTTLATSRVTFTAPRGDLRTTTDVEFSRWITDLVPDHRMVASHHAGLAATEFPSSPREHRLRARAHAVRSGSPLHVDDDPVLERSLRLRAARAADHLTEFDGDLTTSDVPLVRDVVSPSRLEAWAACPHGYFDRYLLGVEPVEEPGDEISITARDRGTAHHDALDAFHQAVVDGLLPQPDVRGWTDEHRQALTAFLHEQCDRTERRGRTGRPAFWADERARMLADLLDWLDHDSAISMARGSTVVASELRFGAEDRVTIALPDGRPVALHGSIDRVDRTRAGGLVVTDHKSGGKKKFADLSADDPTAGSTLFQLPSYAAAARARFGSADTPVLAEYGLLRAGDYARPGYTMTPEVDAEVSRSLALVVAGIESGCFPNRPERPGWRLYVGCPYCEPDGLGTAERWAEWERKRHDRRLAAWFAPEETT